MPIGALFAVVLWLGNTCYLYLSVSFIQMLKAMMPVAVFVVGVMVGTEKYSHRAAINMAVVAFGVAVASYGEISFVLVGVVLQITAIICESFRIVLVQVAFEPLPSVCTHSAVYVQCVLGVFNRRDFHARLLVVPTGLCLQMLMQQGGVKLNSIQTMYYVSQATPSHHEACINKVVRTWSRF